MGWLEAGEGWPLVLLHAFPLNATMWRPQLEAVPAGWRFIAPDFRGFGAGPALDRRVTMDEYARDVLALMDAMQIDESAVGGLSMGGYVTFALLRQAAARFTKVVLADTRPQADTPAGLEARLQLRAALAERGPRAVADQMLPKLLSADADPAIVGRVRATIEAADARAIDAAIGALMDRPDSTPDLARIAVPALVTAGEHDAVTPVSDSDVMQRAIRRSRLVVIPGAAHLASLEQPEVFSRALADFLASAL